MEKSVTLVRFLVALQTTIMLGAIPWAYSVGNSVTALETSLEAVAAREVPPEWFRAQVNRIEERLGRVEDRLHDANDHNP